MLIYSNLWVAFALTSLSFVVSFFLQVSSLKHILFCFCVCYTGYNYIYWLAFKLTPQKLDSERKRWMNNNKTAMWSSIFVSSVIASYLFLTLNPKSQLIAIASSVISMSYLFPSKSKVGLRWIPGAKIVIIALTWTLLISLIIQLDNNNNHFNMYLSLLLFVIATTIPFDIRDITTDAKSLYTIPQLIGINNSIVLSQSLLVISVFLMTCYLPEPSAIVSNVCFLIIGLKILRKVGLQASAQFINFNVEGLPVSWAFLLMISHMLKKQIPVLV